MSTPTAHTTMVVGDMIAIAAANAWLTDTLHIWIGTTASAMSVVYLTCRFISWLTNKHDPD